MVSNGNDHNFNMIECLVNTRDWSHLTLINKNNMATRMNYYYSHLPQKLLNIPEVSHTPNISVMYTFHSLNQINFCMTKEDLFVWFIYYVCFLF